MITNELVERAIVEMRRRPSNYAYFFDRLDSAEWIVPLQQRGFFVDPPAPIFQGDTVRFPIWPESRFLLRMAKECPDDARVVEAALSIPETENVRVHEDIAEIACSVPAKVAVRFVPRAICSLNLPYKLLLPHKLAALVTHLSSKGEVGPAIELARKVFDVFPDPRSGSVGDPSDQEFEFPRPIGHVPNYEYSELLTECRVVLLDVAPKAVMDLFSEILELSVDYSIRGGRAKAPHDHSELWRRDLRAFAGGRIQDLRDTLLSMVVQAADRVLENNVCTLTELVISLEARPWRIFHRLALDLLRQFPKAMETLSSQRLLNRKLFDDPTIAREYWILAKESFARLSRAEQEKILGWINEGPDLKTFKNVKTQWSGVRPSEEESQEFKRRWQLKRLGCIANELPQQWKDRFDMLVKEFGKPEPMDAIRPLVRMLSGAKTPKSPEELLVLPTEEIASFLQNWRPSGDWDAPSEDGLGSALQAAVSRESGRFSREAVKFCGVPAPYVCSVLYGLRDAARERRMIDWGELLPLWDWVLKQTDPCKPGEGKVDSHWEWARKAIADCLRTGLEIEAEGIPYELRESIWSVLQRLCRDPNPTPEHENRYGGDNMDPVTLALNTVRGEAMHGVVRYALWVERNLERANPGDGRQVGFDRMPEVRKILEERLDTSQEQSHAVRSVYGQSVPWLVRLDRDWIKRQVQLIFPKGIADQGLRITAWEAYVVWCQPYDQVIDVLREEYRAAVDRMVPEVTTVRRYQDSDCHLAEHLMAFYGRGKLDLDGEDGILSAFFAAAPARVRRHAIEFIGLSLNNTEGEIPSRILERLMILWDRRVRAARESSNLSDFAEELSCFGWWFASGKLEDNWALEQLSTTLDLAHMAVPDHMVAGRLAELPPSHARAVLLCLDKLIDADREGWGILGWRDKARAVLERGTANADSNVKAMAINIVHKLGARGHQEFRDLVAILPPGS